MRDHPTPAHCSGRTAAGYPTRDRRSHTRSPSLTSSQRNWLRKLSSRALCMSAPVPPPGLPAPFSSSPGGSGAERAGPAGQRRPYPAPPWLRGPSLSVAPAAAPTSGSRAPPPWAAAPGAGRDEDDHAPRAPPCERGAPRSHLLNSATAPGQGRDPRTPRAGLLSLRSPLPAVASGSLSVPRGSSSPAGTPCCAHVRAPLTL